MSDTPRMFDGKVAFVTGGGSGIGRATALAFAAEGASVAVAGPPQADLEQTVQRIQDAGGRVLAVPCDVTQDDQVQQALERTVDAFGRLDIAFNIAGVEQSRTPPDRLTPDGLHGRGSAPCIAPLVPQLGPLETQRWMAMAAAPRAHGKAPAHSS